MDIHIFGCAKYKVVFPFIFHLYASQMLSEQALIDDFEAVFQVDAPSTFSTVFPTFVIFFRIENLIHEIVIKSSRFVHNP